MKRKDFIRRVGALITMSLTGMLWQSSCSKDESVDPETKDCLANGTVIDITSNHGHSLTVSKDDVEKGIAKTYSIEGSADHPHEVTISAAQFAELKDSKTSIQVISTARNGHTHAVTVSCA